MRYATLEAISQIPAEALEQGKKHGKESKSDKNKWGTADLWAGYFVVRRSQPHCGDAPSSRLVSSPTLWPRHPRLFMRWLLASCGTCMGGLPFGTGLRRNAGGCSSGRICT